MDDARLIAWIDGALPPEEARAVAAAVAADPALAAQAERHRRIRAQYRKAFGSLIEEAARMPSPKAAKVVSLAAARARRETAAPPPLRPRRAGLIPAIVAAGLAVGLVVGIQLRPVPGVVDQPGAVTLSGSVARALQHQPSGAAGPVRISLSFRDRAGAWCRSFAASHIAGIACRGTAGWALRYAAAGDDDPGLVRTIGAIAAAPPVDAAAERAAIAGAWR